MFIPYHMQVSFNVAVMHCGAPAGGMNQAAKVVIRDLIRRGHTPYGVTEGFRGYGMVWYGMVCYGMV